MLKRTGLVTALALVLSLVTTGAAVAAPPAGLALTEYGELRAAIERAVPEQHRRSLLAKVDAAERADDRADFCPAVNALSALRNEVRAARGKWLIGDGAAVVSEQIDGSLSWLPPDPCRRAPTQVAAEASAIQRAIDAAADGDILLLGEGVSRGALLITGKRLWIVGAPGGTVLAPAEGRVDARSGVLAYGPGGGGDLRNLTFQGGEYSIRGGTGRASLPASLRIRDIAISGGHRGIYGAFSELTVRDTTIARTSWHGMSLTYASGNVLLAGLDISEAQQVGLFILADGPGDFSVAGHFHHNTRAGIEVHGNGGHVAMFFVTADHNGPADGAIPGFGVMLFGADAGISLSTFTDQLEALPNGCSGVGVYAVDSSVVSIAGSIFRDNCIGVGNIASDMTLAQNDFNSTQPPPRAEGLAGFDGAHFHDLGGNVCGYDLGTPQQVVITCHAGGAIEPPEPIGGLE